MTRADAGSVVSAARHSQAVDNVCQRRSRGAQRLNVRQRVRFASSLAAALSDGLSEQLASNIERAGEYPMQSIGSKVGGDPARASSAPLIEI